MAGERSAEISDLFNTIYPEKCFSPEYVAWRFFDTPFDMNFNIAAYDQDKLIGHAALAPRRLILGGSQVWAGQSLGSVVHPEYQNRGIYTAMARRLYKEAMEKGIKFIWGFPNHRSHYGRKIRLGWRDIYEVPTKRLYFEGISYKVKPAALARESSIKAFDLSGPAVANENGHAVRFVRDRAYFVWRYEKNPRFRYGSYVVEDACSKKEKAYGVVKRFNDPPDEWIDLVDCASEDVEGFEALIDTIILKGLEAKRVKGINLWMNTHHPFSPSLEKRGFVNDKPITFFSYYYKSRDPEDEGLFRVSDFRNWYITMGDSDLY